MSGNGLTLEERATNSETQEHIYRVRSYMNMCIHDLIDRAHEHDQSKLKPPEVEWFTKYTDNLAGTSYDSPEYRANMERMEIAISHHHAHNRHHPQFHRNGIDDMNLMDVLEMTCDWKAASERHDDGNIRKSIEINADKFELSPQVVKLIENTVRMLDL